MSRKNGSDTINTLCDDARMQIAEALPQIASSLVTRAMGQKSNNNEDISLPHLKVLMDLGGFLKLVPVEKKEKSADEDTREGSESGQSAFEKFLKDLLEDEE